MESVTHQNAALMEQASASTTSMAEQAEALTDSVRAFTVARIDRPGAAVPAAHARAPERQLPKAA